MAKRSRGRPRNKTAPRTPSGQISRAAEPANKTALEARMKHHGLTIDQAADQKAGDFIGRLLIAKAIKHRQFRGLEEGRRVVQNYRRAISSPAAIFEAREGIQTVADEDTQAEWVDKQIAKHTVMMAEIMRVQRKERSANLLSVAEFVLGGDYDMPHMIRDIQRVGDVLADHFHIGQDDDV